MKIQHLIACVFLFALMAATDPSKKAAGKIKTFYSSYDKDTIRYAYDAMGRLSSYTAPGYKTTYSYGDHTIIEKTEGGSTVTMFLNRAGWVDSLIDINNEREYNNASPKKHLLITKSFPYSGMYLLSYANGGLHKDNAKIISKKFSYDWNSHLTAESEYVNGKLYATAISTIDKNDNITSYAVKYFFSDSINEINPVTRQKETRVVSLSNWIMKMSYTENRDSSLTATFFGVCSKHLLSRCVRYDIGFESDSTVDTYSYTFDRAGRVSGLTKTNEYRDPTFSNLSRHTIDTASFTYY